MKFRRLAAAVVAGTLAPGALFASEITSSITAYDYDTADAVVTGLTSSWQVEKLRHRPWTLHKGVDSPDTIPQNACRDIANRWNTNVLGTRSLTVFRSLLDSSAQSHCKLEYARMSTPSSDGSFDLTSVAPTK